MNFPKVPSNICHSCRVEFTNKIDLQTDNQPCDDAATGTVPRRSHRDGNEPNPAILSDQCLFCKNLKYQSNTKTRQKLRIVQKFRAEDLNVPYPANYMIRFPIYLFKLSHSPSGSYRARGQGGGGSCPRRENYFFFLT